MLVATELCEHASGVLEAVGLPQDLLSEYHNRIRAEHHGCRTLTRYVLGFGLRDPKHIGDGGFVRELLFIDIRRHHRERERQLGQELSTAW
jgi:hypothetical protein